MTDPRLALLRWLGVGDAQVIATSLGRDPAELWQQLEQHPELIERALSSSELEQVIFESDQVHVGLTPWLVFGAAVHRGAEVLTDASFVTEWISPGKRLPVFDVEPLRELASTPERRAFLVGLLVSFTNVAGGVRLIKTRDGVQEKRWTELNPFDLADLINDVPESQRPAVLRRLGDVSLFLSGVLPDSTASSEISVSDLHRLCAATETDPAGAFEVASGDDGLVGLFEVTGARSYMRAAAHFEGSVLEEIADRFTVARRFFSYLADRYLYRIHPELAA